MSKNITYLLGAGASYHSIPIVNTMNERMLMFLNLIRDYKPFESSHSIAALKYTKLSKELYGRYFNEGFEKYREVVEEAVKHHTVDTYARKLWLKKQKRKLALLKEFLCLYFAFEQSDCEDKLPKFSSDESQYSLAESHIRETLDYRYDVFLATLLDKDMLLPENISIISWNYDYQLELAYMNYTDCDFSEAIESMSIYPGIDDVSQAKIVKLNGSAIQRGYSDASKSFTLEHKNNTNFYSTILSLSLSNGHNPEYRKSKNLIDFAWENYVYQQQAIQRAKEIISATDELIVIGYSFPNFNKKIDAELFSDKYLPYRMEVKIQCPADHYASVEENFTSLNLLLEDEGVVSLHRDITQFYIPAYQLINN